MAKRVLVVDDSSMMRKIIKSVLTPAGYNIIGEAGSGAEAIAMYQSLNPDLVTMDITMRGIDGLSAGKSIKDIDSAAKIVYFSNLDPEKYRDQVMALGGLGIVKKQNTKDMLGLLKDVD